MTPPKVAVVDSGVANLTSVMAALQRLGADAEVTSDAAKIRAASHVILPGVGSASAAMAQLRAKKLVDTLFAALTQPVLGICLGMQLLFARSEEGGGTECLGIIPGRRSKLMPSSPRYARAAYGLEPDCGPTIRSSAAAKASTMAAYVYFVHSYAAPVADTTLATTDYGGLSPPSSGIKIFSVASFIPERSSTVGSRILEKLSWM